MARVLRRQVLCVRCRRWRTAVDEPPLDGFTSTRDRELCPDCDDQTVRVTVEPWLHAATPLSLLRELAQKDPAGWAAVYAAAQADHEP